MTTLMLTSAGALSCAGFGEIQLPKCLARRQFNRLVVEGVLLEHDMFCWGRTLL